MNCTPSVHVDVQIAEARVGAVHVGDQAVHLLPPGREVQAPLVEQVGERAAKGGLREQAPYAAGGLVGGEELVGCDELVQGGHYQRPREYVQTRSERPVLEGRYGEVDLGVDLGGPPPGSAPG
eukprot:CAMPEP_0173224614 /NCGR_PEP_ID=MMETSP1142-20121109/4443_1 /TAXON_ID=483371 /ORGANISM="non described non described, Strain CCMP2298" /LENGTH=122 /DNA_ID=CAMNT_0014152913 /DNA_START=307 /DNA_END=675 /DNA_ORIENTATION=+